MSEKQQKSWALEETTYEILKQFLADRLRNAGRETRVPNGWLWRAKCYSLFYNRQVVKKGQYSSALKFKRKRIADLVLCDRRLNADVSLGGLYKTAILAIELKNTNLDYKWGRAWMFDRDILSRFLWTQDSFETLSVNGWEAQAGQSNLFPNAIKVLITPRFAYLPAASNIPVLKLDPFTRRIVARYRTEGLIPYSSSEKDQIEWRIKRVGLHIEELDWQLRPNIRPPEWVIPRLEGILNDYLDQLGFR